jgi:hypothetical protein
MALHGRKAIFEFRRKLIPPVILPVGAINTATGVLMLDSDQIWTGDQVVLTASVGGVATTFNGYIFLDELGNASIHSTIVGALSNTSNTRVSLSGVQSRISLLALKGHSCQSLELTKIYYFLLNNPNYPISQETTLAIAPEKLDQYWQAGPQYVTWKVVGDARQWTLSTSSNAIDVSEIGEKYFSGLKAVISGSGTTDFLVNIYGSETTLDSYNLLRVAMLTGDGSEALARFYLDRGNSVAKAGPNSDKKKNSSTVYYSTKILITNSSVDTSADGLVVGSADFVTTGPLRLGTQLEPDGVYSCEGDSELEYNVWSWSTYTSETPEYGATGGFSTNSNTGNPSTPVQSAWVDSSGNSYIYGTYQGASNDQGYLLTKFNPLGVEIWTRRYICNDSDANYVNLPSTRPPMAIGEDGSVWISMSTTSILSSPKFNNYVAKINPQTGDVISSFCFSVKDDLINSYSSLPYVYHIAGDNEGFVYLAMYLSFPSEQGSAPFGTYRHRHAVCKVNQFGDLVWSRLYRGAFDGFFRSDINAPISEIRPRGNKIYLYFNEAYSYGNSSPGLTILDKQGQIVLPSTGYLIQRSPSEAFGVYYDKAMFTGLAFDSSGNIYIAVRMNTQELYAILKINGTNYQTEWFRNFKERDVDTNIDFGATHTVSIHIDSSDRIFLLGQHAQYGSSDPTGLSILELNPSNGDLIAARKVSGAYTNVGNNNVSPSAFSFMRYQQPLGSYLYMYSESFGIIALLEKEGQFGVWPMINASIAWTIYQPNIFVHPLLASQRIDLTGGEAYSDFNVDINWINYGKQVVAASLIRPLYARFRIPIGNYSIPD